MIPIKDTIPARAVPLVNWILIGLNVFVFMGELSAGPNLDWLVASLGVIPLRFMEYHDAREIMTLFTSQFLHAGWFHLFSNMLALYIFGDNVEDRMGPARYLVFYLLCGAAAGLVHIWFNPYSRLPTIGASGAIAGVLGAYLVLFPFSRVITLVPIFFMPYFIELPALIYLGIWFLSQLLSGVASLSISAYQLSGGVAYWAHAGGFVAGLALVAFFAQSKRRIRRRYYDEYFPW